jgi:hypothetical protein
VLANHTTPASAIGNQEQRTNVMNGEISHAISDAERQFGVADAALRVSGVMGQPKHL